MIAFVTAVSLSALSVVIRSVSLDFGMVKILSKFTAHSVGIPSSSPRGTSTGMLRIVRVTMAMVTEVRTLYAVSLDSSNTGRLPMGGDSSAQHISPRRIYQGSSDRT